MVVLLAVRVVVGMGGDGDGRMVVMGDGGGDGGDGSGDSGDGGWWWG